MLLFCTRKQIDLSMRRITKFLAVMIVSVFLPTLCLAVGGLIYAGVKHMPKLKNAFNRHKDDTVIDTEAEFTNIEE